MGVPEEDLGFLGLIWEAPRKIWEALGQIWEFLRKIWGPWGRFGRP